MEKLLDIRGIQKSYGKHRVLRGGDMHALAGQLICVVGENGSGKSTLMKILVGVLKADAGRVECSAKVGYCPQESLLYDYLTVREHFELFGRAYSLSGTEVDEATASLLQTFNYDKFVDFKVHQLSGGTRQKLNLSLALLHNPDILILDEPYSGFDWDTYQHFLGFADQARTDGKCVIMVSHLVFERELFDSVFSLDEGILRKES
jgi:ABC-type multidrug transport system ATPase subunit